MSNSENLDPKTLELKESFDMFDRDKDGLINHNELGCVLRTQGISCSDQELNDMITMFDKDEDKKIEFSEFISLMHSRLKKKDSENELTDAFRYFDKEGTGKLNVNEFKHIMSSLGEKICEEEVNEMIKRADPKNTGYIDYKNFIQIILEQ